MAEAVALVDAEGAGELTLAALAKRFGVALPSLYKHVGGLDDLHGRLALVAARDLGTALRKAATGRSGRAAVAAVARAYRGYAQAHPGCYDYLLRPRPDDAEHAAASQEVLDVLYAVFDGYSIRSGPPAVDAARLVRSTLHGFVALENAGGFAMARSVDRSFEKLVDALDTALSHWGGSTARERVKTGHETGDPTS